MVEAEPGEGRATDRGGNGAAVGAGGDRGGQGRRPLGAGLRRAVHRDRAAGLPGRAGPGPAAEEFFGTLNKVNRFAVCYRLQEAKKPETRTRRIEKFVQMFAEGKKIHG
ncbi:bacteriocin-protection, YdeI/OmpD-Associated family protein [Rhodococcus sp. MTM3W5.2]|nr:bacteriocin-protection, YdeI/OmpD-Associated family protein [Rhodococcus sp. MTM3W5.2]